jgi:hypothetical protein
MVRFIGTVAFTCLAAITGHSTPCSRLGAEPIKSNASAVSPGGTQYARRSRSSKGKGERG